MLPRMSNEAGKDREQWLEAVGRAIRELRERTDLSQEALGYESGLHRTYVSDVERGQRNPTVWTLVRLAETLGTEPSEILRRAEVRLREGGK